MTGFSVYATQRPRDHICARHVAVDLADSRSLLAFSLMPLAGAVAINFSAPLFAALVSIVWLKERAGFARWAALADRLRRRAHRHQSGRRIRCTLGALFALVNAIMYGSVTVAVRGMTRTESANTLVIWQLTVHGVPSRFLLLFGWRWPTPIDAALLFGTGFTNAVGQWFWTKALQLAPARR